MVDEDTQTLLENPVHQGTQMGDARPPLIKTEEEHVRLEAVKLKRELMLIVRRVRGKTETLWNWMQCEK